jgi:hypothetical protein
MTAIVFVPLFALTTIFAFGLWCYASHVFVSVTEETAAGNEVIVWDDGGFIECFREGILLGWLVGIWLVPASFVAGLATSNLDLAGRPYAFALIAFLVFWLGFPLSLLSSMAAESRLAIFHPELFQRLARRGLDVIIFYILSGFIVAACVPLAPWLVTGNGYWPFLVAAPLLALAVLLYARLMGRLACLARLTRIRRRKKKKKAKEKPKGGVAVSDPWDVPDEVRREEEARGTGFVQPSELPPVDSPYEGEITGYDVNFADVPKEPARPSSAQEKPAAWGEVGTERIAAREPRGEMRKIEPDKLEMDRLRRKKEKAPDHPWADRRVWLFVVDSMALARVGFLALGIAILGVLVQVLIELWPV